MFGVPFPPSSATCWSFRHSLLLPPKQQSFCKWTFVNVLRLCRSVLWFLLVSLTLVYYPFNVLLSKKISMFSPTLWCFCHLLMLPLEPSIWRNVVAERMRNALWSGIRNGMDEWSVATVRSSTPVSRTTPIHHLTNHKNSLRSTSRAAHWGWTSKRKP